MLLVEPFKALRYDPKRVGSLARVVTAPYDVISRQGQQDYYRKHRYNFIRVIYGRQYPSDTQARNRYSRAKQNLSRWRRLGVLKPDAQPGLYPYEQKVRLAGKTFRRLGVLALVGLDSLIYPHEKIHGGPKRDRLELMKRVQASLDPIFGLIPDAGGQYRKTVEKICQNCKPIASFEFEGVRHRLWQVTQPAWIKKLQSSLRHKSLVIADGHHRFEAARAYWKQSQRKNRSRYRRDPCGFVMFYLSAAGTEDPGLLPTHRLVRTRPPLRFKRAFERAKAQGKMESVTRPASLVQKLRILRAKEQWGIGLYTGNGAGYLLRPRGRSIPDLDVEWLHETILPKWLGSKGYFLTYTQDLEAATQQVRRGQAQAVFILQPPRLKDVLRRAQAFQRMPRKTTYFYPKLVSGLVGYSFEE